MIDYSSRVKSNIKSIRLHHGYSMQTVQELSGLSLSTVSLAENVSSSRSLNIDTIAKIADVFDINPGEFFVDENKFVIKYPPMKNKKYNKHRIKNVA